MRAYSLGWSFAQMRMLRLAACHRSRYRSRGTDDSALFTAAARAPSQRAVQEGDPGLLGLGEAVRFAPTQARSSKSVNASSAMSAVRCPLRVSAHRPTRPRSRAAPARGVPRWPGGCEGGPSLRALSAHRPPPRRRGRLRMLALRAVLTLATGVRDDVGGRRACPSSPSSGAVEHLLERGTPPLAMRSRRYVAEPGPARRKTAKPPTAFLLVRGLRVSVRGGT